MSLSPPVNKIEFGAHEAKRFFAESTLSYLSDLSWSFQFSFANIIGDVKERKIDSPIAIFYFFSKLLINVKIKREPKPIQIENV